jgi:hypothetical protein
MWENLIMVFGRRTPGTGQVLFGLIFNAQKNVKLSHNYVTIAFLLGVVLFSTEDINLN